MFDKKIHIKAIMTSTKGHPYICQGVCVLSIKRWDMFKKKFRLTALGLVFDAAVYFNHLTVKEKLTLLVSFIIFFGQYNLNGFKTVCSFLPSADLKSITVYNETNVENL